MRARLQKSESVKWTSHDGVMVCKWHDKHDKVVLGMTLCDQHDATDKSSICRCPSALWTTTATWVAWIDQMRAYYSVGRAGCCWGKYIFWGLLNVGLINSLHPVDHRQSSSACLCSTVRAENPQARHNPQHVR